MNTADLRVLAAARRRRQVAVLMTRLSDGTQHLLVDDGGGLQGDLAPALLRAAREAARTGHSLNVNCEASGAGEDGDWFVQLHAPRPLLVLVGAVHVAQALAPLARTLGMMVRIIDPRAGFATAERFPGVALVDGWPDEALAQHPLDAHTALVTLSHEARLDDPALDAALRGPAFYIGALGSRKTQAARRARLAAIGHDEAALSRLHGPVGLPIGAIGAEEIALSIIAEIVAVRRGAAS